MHSTSRRMSHRLPRSNSRILTRRKQFLTAIPAAMSRKEKKGRKKKQKTHGDGSTGTNVPGAAGTGSVPPRQIMHVGYTIYSIC